MPRATGAPVYCPELEDRCSPTSRPGCLPGFGPYESYDADETVAGGERLELAGLEIEVVHTPGHSPGHVTYAIPAEQALFSGDVLFQGSVGRVDLPGGDGPTLLRTLRELVEALSGRDHGLPRPHGDHDAGGRARDEPVSGRASRRVGSSR